MTLKIEFCQKLSLEGRISGTPYRSSTKLRFFHFLRSGVAAKVMCVRCSSWAAADSEDSGGPEGDANK